MAVVALAPDYEKHIEFRDAERNFHGNRLFYIQWQDHQSYAAPAALALPPSLNFGELLRDIVAPLYAAHPDLAQIDWTKAIFEIDGERKKPDFSRNLDENGLVHKSLIRFWTPGLDGFRGMGV